MSPTAKVAICAALLGAFVWVVLRTDMSKAPGADDGCRTAHPGSSPRCARTRASRARVVRPRDARAFVDTIGVNTHLWYLDTSYGDYAMVKRRLLEVGVRHIRDGLDPARTPTFYRRVNDLAAAGVKSTLIACRVEPVGVPWTTYVKEAKSKVRRSLDALEGVNEPDLVAAGRPDWPRFARACQREIYRQATRPSAGAPLRVPVVGPSVQAGERRIGDLTDRARGGAMHPYPGGGPPSGPYGHPFRSQMADVRRNQFGGARVPVYATETGYHDALNTTGVHAPASQRAASIYLPRLFLEYARAGVRRTFAYELVDERPDPALRDVELNYGLFESDWSYKPSAIALRNTVALLNSPRRGPRRSLRYALANTADPDGAGPRGAVKSMLLQKANGSYWLALWQDSKAWDENARVDITNPSTPVQVTLPRRMRLTSFHPTQSSAGSNRRTARSFTAEVGDDVLLIKMS